MKWQMCKIRRDLGVIKGSSNVRTFGNGYLEIVLLNFSIVQEMSWHLQNLVHIWNWTHNCKKWKTTLKVHFSAKKVSFLSTRSSMFFQLSSGVARINGAWGRPNFPPPRYFLYWNNAKVNDIGKFLGIYRKKVYWLGARFFFSFFIEFAAP